MQSLQNKIVLITGAGSGIGRELALACAGEGARLALNDWNEAALTETWEMLPPTARGIRAAYDVGDRVATERFIDRAATELGGLDMVVNNAGITLPMQRTAQYTVEDYERVLRINLWGVIYGSLAALPHLRKRKTSVLVNISSVFGLFGYPLQNPYSTSKFAVRGFTETLRNEAKGSGLQVVSVHPGGIKTNIVRNVEAPDSPEREKFIQRFEKQAKTTAPEAARIILNGVRRGKTRVLIGPDARFIDYIVRLMPQSYGRVLLRWLKPE
jgi:butyryl-CoA dehydrogenase